MKRRGVIVFALTVLGLFSFETFASEREQIYRAYVAHDLTSWRAVIDGMNREENKSSARELELLNYEYGYIALALMEERKNEAERYLERAEERLDLLEERGYRPPILYAYSAALKSYRVALRPIRATTLGVSVIGDAKQSVAEDENNWFGYIQLANTEFYAPAIVGGSKKKGLELFLKAEELMVAQGEEDHWSYLMLLATIGSAYNQTGDDANARAYFAKALELEPDFKWAKELMRE